MTTGKRAGAYSPPKDYTPGFYFDGEGNLFGDDGKAIAGARINTQGLKAPATNQGQGIASLLTDTNKPENPYTQGGRVSRLVAGDNGELFAEIGTPGTSKPGATKGPGGNNAANTTPSSINGLFGGPEPQRVKVEGFALDPGRTTRSGTGTLGDNNVYLRNDGNGLYFAQVKQGADILAYSYNRYQTPGVALGSTQTDETQARAKKGGNLRGGAGITPQTGTLLGG